MARWYHFSLRQLFVIVSLVAVLVVTANTLHRYQFSIERSCLLLLDAKTKAIKWHYAFGERCECRMFN